MTKNVPNASPAALSAAGRKAMLSYSWAELSKLMDKVVAKDGSIQNLEITALKGLAHNRLIISGDLNLFSIISDVRLAKIVVLKSCSFSVQLVTVKLFRESLANPETFRSPSPPGSKSLIALASSENLALQVISEILSCLTEEVPKNIWSEWEDNWGKVKFEIADALSKNPVVPDDQKVQAGFVKMLVKG